MDLMGKLIYIFFQVCGYLIDDHFVEFLIRCSNALNDNVIIIFNIKKGIIVVKENHT